MRQPLFLQIKIPAENGCAKESVICYNEDGKCFR